MTPRQRKEFLQTVVEGVIIDRNHKVNITPAIPINSKPTTEVSDSIQTLAAKP